MRPGRSFLVTAAAFLLSTAPILAAAGTAVGVDPDAEARISQASRVLVVGSDLDIGETVVTGAVGQVEIIFTDETKLVVGPSSTLLLEDYLLRNDGSAGRFAINALQGSFRFMTGKAPKDQFDIRTATGTIGIRGTQFDFVVDPVKGETFLVIYDGAATVCNYGGKCVEMNSRCDIASFGKDAILLDGSKKIEWQEKFPYANHEYVLSSDFHVPDPKECVRVDPALKESLPADASRSY